MTKGRWGKGWRQHTAPEGQAHYDVAYRFARITWDLVLLLLLLELSLATHLASPSLFFLRLLCTLCVLLYLQSQLRKPSVVTLMRHIGWNARKDKPFGQVWLFALNCLSWELFRAFCTHCYLYIYCVWGLRNWACALAVGSTIRLVVNRHGTALVCQ